MAIPHLNPGDLQYRSPCRVRTGRLQGRDGLEAVHDSPEDGGRVFGLCTLSKTSHTRQLQAIAFPKPCRFLYSYAELVRYTTGCDVLTSTWVARAESEREYITVQTPEFPAGAREWRREI